MSTISGSIRSKAVDGSIHTKTISGKINSSAAKSANNIITNPSEVWNSQPDTIASKNVLYVYSDYQTIVDDVGNVKNIPKAKIGDGTSYLIDLPFLNVTPEEFKILTDTVTEHINNGSIHVSHDDRVRWDNPSETSYFVDNENLLIEMDNGYE